VPKKLEKILEWRYIMPCLIKSLTSFFSVPKGEFNVQTVFDSTVSGLNDSIWIWIPGFSLLMVQTHLRVIGKDTFVANVDVGEMFLNFHLHKVIQAFVGVDLTQFFDSPDGVLRWEVWCHCVMGLTSPYIAIMGFAEEVI
jgi:hypothetical protein